VKEVGMVGSYSELGMVEARYDPLCWMGSQDAGWNKV